MLGCDKEEGQDFMDFSLPLFRDIPEDIGLVSKRVDRAVIYAHPYLSIS